LKIYSEKAEYNTQSTIWGWKQALILRENSVRGLPKYVPDIRPVFAGSSSIEVSLILSIKPLCYSNKTGFLANVYYNFFRIRMFKNSRESTLLKACKVSTTQYREVNTKANRY